MPVDASLVRIFRDMIGDSSRIVGFHRRRAEHRVGHSRLPRHGRHLGAVQAGLLQRVSLRREKAQGVLGAIPCDLACHPRRPAQHGSRLFCGSLPTGKARGNHHAEHRRAAREKRDPRRAHREPARERALDHLPLLRGALPGRGDRGVRGPVAVGARLPALRGPPEARHRLLRSAASRRGPCAGRKAGRQLRPSHRHGIHTPRLAGGRGSPRCEAIRRAAGHRHPFRDTPGRGGRPRPEREDRGVDGRAEGCLTAAGSGLLEHAAAGSIAKRPPFWYLSTAHGHTVGHARGAALR